MHLSDLTRNEYHKNLWNCKASGICEELDHPDGMIVVVI